MGTALGGRERGKDEGGEAAKVEYVVVVCVASSGGSTAATTT